MKAIFKTLRNCVLTATLLIPTMTFAHDYDPAHWVAEINDTVRLCDLSIPEAHDAATWHSGTGFIKDQEYSERELFLKGVRAFDMRLHYDEDGSTFDHGCFTQNTIKDEIEKYFPTDKDLEDEFMVLFFQYENDGDYLEKIMAFQEFVDCLVEKYGIDRFVRFSRFLTVKDVRNRIILVATGNDYNTNKLDHNKVPVALVHNGGDPKIYPNGTIESFPDFDINELLHSFSFLPKPNHNEIIQFFEQNCYDLDREDKKEKIKIGLEGDGKTEGWFQYLERTNNVERKFHKTQINSYYFSIWRTLLRSGKGICIDDSGFRDRKGCNHYTYDLLNNHKGQPFGFVRFDYIGCGGDFYGDKLLDLIVDNNMHNSFYGNGGRKVEDVEKNVEDEIETEIEDEIEAYVEDYNEETEVVEEVQPVIYNDGYMLYVENYEDNAIFNVYDMGRNTVAHSTTTPIEISHLKKGIYILEINGKGYKFVKK